MKNFHSLQFLTQKKVFELLLAALVERKRSIGRWLVDQHEWLRAMQLKPLADWLTQGLPIEEVRAILRQGLKRLTDARDRDLLACCFAMLVHGHRLVGQQVEVPACLRHDQATRTLLLELLSSGDADKSRLRLRHLNLACYSGFGAAPYASEESEISQ
jgi:hypothetical protein